MIRPAKLWCDTSTASECEEITAALGGPRATLRALGNAVLPGFTAGKILWLKRHEPENFARLATVLLPHDYLNWWLTGSTSMEYGDASGTALIDVAAAAGATPPPRPSIRNSSANSPRSVPAINRPANSPPPAPRSLDSTPAPWSARAAETT